MKRVPRPPPTTEDAHASAVAGAQHLLLPYYHWDELRRRPVLEGYTHGEWWSFVKAVRVASYVELPLLSVDGRHARFVMTNELQRRTHELDRTMSGAFPPPDDVRGPLRDRYLLDSLQEEAITSSQLEGAATTHQVALEMLRSNRAPRTVDERMIANNFAAMQWIRTTLRDELSLGMLLELHRIVTEGAIAEGGAGRLRRVNEQVVVADPDGEVVHTPPPADTLEERITAMCRFANGPDAPGLFVHPILKAIALHFWLAYDHPFVDGNGRTARALFYWFMLREGYWLTEFVTISRVIKNAPAQYARAFEYVETDDHDLTYFFLHQVDVLEKSVQGLLQHLAQKRAEANELPATIDANPRQRALLGHALRKPATEYTIAGHQQRHGIVYDTARLDLQDLARRHLLTKQKRGREFVYVVGPRLKKLIG